MAVYVGLDIGGTKFLAAAANSEGDILRTARADTPVDLAAGLALLEAMVRDVAQGEPIQAIGAAIGGPLDWRSGVVSPLHQPQWRDVPLKAIVEQTWSCPFSVDVDTNVAALGEYYIGRETAGRFLYLTLSTGMGGGLLIDGKVYRGTRGEHPEVGHQSIPYRCAHPERVRCECGVPDCLEALVSGNGIRRVYGKAPAQLDRAEWAEVAYNLGQGLRNLAAIYLPDVIVLGGGVAIGGGENLLGETRRVLAEHLRLVPVPEIRLSRLGRETALRGALVLALRGASVLET
jgi:glucokinase